MSDTKPHPEDYCQRCNHRMRLNYSADNDCWNQVMGRESVAEWSIICIDCFIELCQAKDIEPKFVAFHIPGSEFYINIPELEADQKRLKFIESLINKIQFHGLSLFKPDQSKEKRSGRVSWGDKNPDTLEDVGLVYYHFERIRMGKSPYKNEYYSTKPLGNFGKAGNLIKDSIRRGYDIPRLVASIIEYHQDNDKWVEGHPIDRWASQIDKYVKRSDSKTKHERKKHYIDPDKIKKQEAEELEKYKNGIRRRKNSATS